MVSPQPPVDPASSAAVESILVLRAQLGERDAFVGLHQRYQRKLLYFLRRLLGASGCEEDVLQEVWVTVVRKIRSLEQPQAFKSWIYRIAHRRAVSRLRQVRPDVSLAELPEEPEAPVDKPSGDADQVFAGYDATALHSGLQQLSLPHREVLTLRFLEELSYSEIADVVGVGVGTVRSRLHYAKKSLHNILTNQLTGSET